MKPGAHGAGAAAGDAGGAGRPERLQKLIAALGLASRREAEAWIRAGRLTINGHAAVLGARVTAQDELRLDGRLIRRRALPAAAPVLLCHRSPGEPLLPAGERTARASFAERLPQRAGHRFVSISPMPTPDGGLELLTADGALAARLQRAVGRMEVEFSLRVRGVVSEAQRQALLADGVASLTAGGGEGSNRWYQLGTRGMSGAQLRALLERHSVQLNRALRVRLGPLALPATLPRGRWRALEPAELSAALGSPDSDR